jgi:hypothetical protein
LSFGRLVRLGIVTWLLRWLAGELATRAGHRWLPAGPPPRDSAHPPGWMPGPAHDERL